MGYIGISRTVETSFREMMFLLDVGSNESSATLQFSARSLVEDRISIVIEGWGRGVRCMVVSGPHI